MSLSGELIPAAPDDWSRTGLSTSSVESHCSCASELPDFILLYALPLTAALPSKEAPSSTEDIPPRDVPVREVNVA